MTTALATQSGNGRVRPAPPNFSFGEIQQLAEVVARSRLFPGVENPQAAFALMMVCQAEGIHPMKAMQRYHIIEGRLSMKADAMLAEFQARGGRVKWLVTNDKECSALFSHPELMPEPVESGFTFEELDRKGVTKGREGLKKNWRQWPAAMLRARTISAGVRMVDPGVVAGVYTPEEVVDFGPEDVELQVIEGQSTPALEYTPEKPQRPQNNSGHKSGQYASPEQVTAYMDALKGFLAEKNARWLDAISPNGETPASVTRDPLNVWQADNHLVKWSVETGRLAPETPSSVKARQIGHYTAIVYHRSKADRKALAQEMDRYADEQLARATEALYRKHPELRDEIEGDAAYDVDETTEDREPGSDDL